MKRTTKKYLMLVLTLVVLMTAMVFSASAAAECPPHVTYEGSTIEPTCTDWGYTEVWCNKCGQYVGETKLVEPIGHSYEWNYIPVNDTETGEHFVNEGRCKYGCNTTDLERDENGNTVIYYSVEFKNPMEAAAYDPQIKYVDVVSARVGIENAVSLATIYVKSGEAAQYDGKAYCERDHKYGKYTFIGWVDEAGYEKIEPPAIGEDAAEINAANDEKKANIQKYLGETAITENTVLYAAFEADNGVTYDVYFHDENGQELAVAKAVPHGTAVVYKGKQPTKDADVKNRYEFLYWSHGINEVNLDQIYGDASFIARYKPIARQYNLTYYFDEACTQPLTTLNGDPVKDGAVEYEGRAGNGLAINGLTEKKNAENDPRYLYAWTGEWQLASRPGYIVDLNMITVPHGTPDNTDGSSEVRLIPVFEKTNKIYPLNITLIYPDDNNYHPEEIDLQILNADGFLVGATKVTKVNQDGVDTYKYTYNVNYSSQFSVSASAVGYTGTGYSTFFNEPSGVIITMEKVAPHSCGCICHTFLKPIWVGLLNFLNMLFGIEHVCCSDMYANIGSQLRYGPGK